MSNLAADLVPVTERMIQGLLEDLREADKLELEAIRGWTAEDEVRNAIKFSANCQACVVGDMVLAIFGDSAHDEVYGLPWMASTNAIIRYRRQFLAHCRPVVEAMRHRHLWLINMADARNTLAIRWLTWLGFKFQPAVPYGINGELFHPFHMEGAKCAQ
ncbi:hypothetical protein BK645_09900 [Pseudomonas protegens]|uniref:hypothetical protein n=1 Tax=Pseudomonas protegens TaxID=380021 RepID=UPI00036F45AD|nr:hypothetical protein [Pseudomonas protegens]ROM29273.1 hypothetical protein BK645_09900 [Pseudomonas protegens]ROM36905.1 hypothetical protein BK646_17940 [Pseudomonas protegens]